VNPETGKQRVLVKDLDMVWAAEWSADGRWVAYETGGPGGENATALWVVGASQEPRRVATGWSSLSRQLELGWRWSPTGAELVTLHRSRLRTIDPATGETTDIGSIPENVGDVTSPPAWSPDRTRIVLGARGGSLYLIDVGSGGRSRLVRLPGEHLDSVDQIEWSSDGAHIAVMNDLAPGGGRLYVMNADGSSVRVLVDDFTPAGVAWSPDGTRLAYADGSWATGKLRIWVAPMDGSAPAEIGSPTVASCAIEGVNCGGDLTWSPDGSRIAFQIQSNVFLENGARLSEGNGYVLASTIDADGSGDEVLIDELTYRSWDGGSYPPWGR
jgi:Tol biopolymer transport system component